MVRAAGNMESVFRAQDAQPAWDCRMHERHIAGATWQVLLARPSYARSDECRRGDGVETCGWGSIIHLGTAIGRRSL